MYIKTTHYYNNANHTGLTEERLYSEIQQIQDMCVYISSVYIYIYGQMIYIHTHIYKQILTRSHIYVCVYALEFVHDHHSITYLVVNLCNYNNVIICKNVAFSHE